MLLAYVVAALHAAAVVLLLSGALLALRWRWLVPVHLAVTAATAAVHLAGADCPLTTWERALRERAGAGYDGGFLDHYLFGPLGTTGSQVALWTYAAVLAPNLLGYGLLLARRRSARAQRLATARQDHLGQPLERRRAHLPPLPVQRHVDDGTRVEEQHR